MKDFVIRKCNHCNAIVRVIEDCDCKCGIVCCGEEMKKMSSNSTDGAREKHVPEYIIKGDLIEVTVNHVMDPDHYIEWIAAFDGKEENIKYFNPGEKPKAIFKYRENMSLYSYCNKHFLWKSEVK